MIGSTSIARHRTALRRTELSRPLRISLEEGLINTDTQIFDYGCGYGDDVANLLNKGINCAGWDPTHRPETQRTSADVVNLGYVVNVIENREERISVLRDAWDLTRKLLIVSARLAVEAKEKGQTPYEDGWLTQAGTFQKYYEQHELRDWIDNVLGVSSLPAAPGIFYVFRDDSLRQSFGASRYRRRITAPRLHRSNILFEKHKDLLEPLIEFITSRGRLPNDSELDVAPLIRNELGSLKRAFGIIRRVTGSEQWDRISNARSQDLLLYLALARFSGRPRFSRLPPDLQLDIRAFFSTYNRACTESDKLLFAAGNRKVIEGACRKSSVGKLTPNALYIHVTALANLPTILRVYEGCARTYVGAVEGANIIKLHRDAPQVSYLSYPEFERDPHPVLEASLIVNFQTLQMRYQEYSDSRNPPILHRKEDFLSIDHPLRAKFARLTKQEGGWHLYEKPELIGTKEGWQKELNERGVYFSGHKLLRKHC
jgi:DNA phosphorothioation-associated putative methyltransferase